MVKEKTVKIECPKCKLAIGAKVQELRDFLIYICPKCQSNVVYYNNKVDIISDKLLRKLLKQKRLASCGQIEIVDHKPHMAITMDDVTDLKISLETSKSVDDFLAKL